MTQHRSPIRALDLYRRLIGPRLTELLADSSVSYKQVAEKLRLEFGLHVSPETLRRWALELDLRVRRTHGQKEAT